MDFSNKYIVGFAFLLCLVCSMAVSSLSVSLKERQEVNKLLDQRTNVLKVAGIVEPDAKLTKEEVDQFFTEIEELVIDRAEGRPDPAADPVAVDPPKDAKDLTKSVEAPANLAKRTQVRRLPDQLEVYRVNVPGSECWVMPIWGNGLWSTLYGYLAVSLDAQEIVGITYYQHKETPGLGGEVDNPTWKAQWPGKVAYDDNWTPRVTVVKAGTAVDSSYQVDGLSGATITGNGVSAMVELWLGPDGYGTFLKNQAASL
ncbi:MAG: NADH:ubiquinone reductase (Na(+)-transporting) subunit C [Planctomycetota bacterium]